MTMVDGEALADEDELELSIDFSPTKAESTLIRNSPQEKDRPNFKPAENVSTEAPESHIEAAEDLTTFMLNEGTTGSFYKLKKIKVSRTSKVSNKPHMLTI